METILLINSSPFLTRSLSRALTYYFIEKYSHRFKEVKITERDIAKNSIPHLVEEELRTHKLSDKLVQEFNHTDMVVFGLPVHNASIPSTLKAYLDHISQSNEVIKADKQIFVIITSGGHKQENNNPQEYIKKFFSLRGLNQVIFITAPGTCFKAGESVADAKQTIDHYFEMIKPSIEPWQELLTLKPEKKLIADLAADFPVPKMQSINNSPRFFDKMVRFRSSIYWPIHCLEDSQSKLNLDYYPILIYKLPRYPGKPNRFISASEFLNYIRLYFNKFIDTNLAIFKPYDKVNEAKWLSDNCYGSVLHINLAPKSKGKMGVSFPELKQNFDPEHASVVVSNTEKKRWIFSTLWTPRDLSHPLCGNREFGFSQIGSAYLFYTKGVSRITGLLPTLLDVDEEPIFNNGDKLWRSFQEKICQFVMANDGYAKVWHESTQSQRYEWDFASLAKPKL